MAITLPSAEAVDEEPFPHALLREGTRQELEAAFKVFSSLSLRLEETYRDLESRVASLDEQLRVARMEREIQRAEKEHIAERMAGLMAELPAGVVLIGALGRVEDANPAARKMLDGLEAGAHWESVVRGNLVGSDDSGKMVIGRHRRITLTRRELGGGACVVVLTDVTQLHELEQRVARNQRLTEMGEMAARLAHQIRTPVASAMLYTSGLTAARDPGTRRSAHRILERLRHLEAVINDMLLFARGGAADLERLSAREIVSRTLETLAPEARRAVRVAGGGEAVTGRALVNRDMIVGALANLVANALEWGAENVEIAWRTSSEGYLEISVADDGPGVPEDIAGRIFEPFFTTRSGGTGLGLAVVRSVAESLGGSVHQEAGASGGAVFRLRLPVENALQEGPMSTQADGVAP